MKRRQEGMALLSALLFMLAIVVTLGSIFYRHQLDVMQSMGFLHTEQARLLVMSVEGWAAQQLSSAMDDRSVDALTELWARPVPAMPVDEAMVSGCLVDLQGRFNLNNFADYGVEQWTEEMESDIPTGLAGLWLALLAQQGLPASEEQVAALIDWLDADQQVINAWGAEQGWYDSERLPQRVTNGLVTDVDELSLVRGYSPEMVAVLAPWMSALPNVTALNINTVSQPLLWALAGEQGERFVDLVLNARPFNDLNHLWTTLSSGLRMSDEAVRARWPGTLVTVQSDYFALMMRLSLGDVTLDSVSLLERVERDWPVVIQRNMQRVPVIDRRGLGPEEQALLLPVCDREGVSTYAAD